MQLERINNTRFIRRHCGSVAIEAPKGRATGAQRQVSSHLPSVHLQGNRTGSQTNHPAGHAFPSGTCVLRISNP